MKTISPFQELVYEATKKIPRGRISTYFQVAKYIGNEKACQAVGNALNKNPFAPKVPCHRVVSSSGSLGGYAFGEKKKIRLLREEGVLVADNKIIEFENKLFEFKE